MVPSCSISRQLAGKVKFIALSHFPLIYFLCLSYKSHTVWARLPQGIFFPLEKHKGASGVQVDVLWLTIKSPSNQSTFPGSTNHDTSLPYFCHTANTQAVSQYYRDLNYLESNYFFYKAVAIWWRWDVKCISFKQKISFSILLNLEIYLCSSAVEEIIIEELTNKRGKLFFFPAC